MLPPVAARATGPLGLARWDHRPGEPAEVHVFPDLRTARRLVLTVARGRFRDPGATARGPLGLGTEFELVRDYQPDDDIRQVNWRATARLGRPMSNQYRLEQDRDLLLLIDAGRLSAAPLVAPEPGAAVPTVLDAALDAAAAVGLVADELGDRCGAVAFDAGSAPRCRRAGRAARSLVRALFDLEPRPVDSDYERAFRRAEGAKRALVLVLCDVLEEAAARPLADAVPVLARRHAVVVACPVRPAHSQALAADRRRRRAPAARARRRGRRRAAPRGRARRPRASGRRARRSWRRRRTGCPPPAWPPTCGRRRGRGCEPGRPRQATSPQNSDEQRRRRSPPARATGSPGPVRNPSHSPHTTSHGTVPAAISTAGRGLGAQRGAAPPRSRADQRPAHAQPGDPAARRCRRAPAARARRPGAGTRSRGRRRPPARPASPAAAR